MTLFLRRVLLACALLSMGGQALAESGVVEISGVRGKVLVNAGNGYTPATDMTLLSEGDMVMVGDDGSASIRYVATNCRVSLPARTVTTITLPEPCKTVVTPASSHSSIVSQPALWIALGGVAFVGGVAYLASQHDNEEGNPTPPTPPGASPP